MKNIGDDMTERKTIGAIIKETRAEIERRKLDRSRGFESFMLDEKVEHVRRNIGSDIISQIAEEEGVAVISASKVNQLKRVWPENTLEYLCRWLNTEELEVQETSIRGAIYICWPKS